MYTINQYMIRTDEISPQFILLILIFLVVGLMYLFFMITTYFRVRRIMVNNRNYVGKLFYICKFVLCLFRVAASVTMIYYLILGTKLSSTDSLKVLLLNILYIPQVILIFQTSTTVICWLILWEYFVLMYNNTIDLQRLPNKVPIPLRAKSLKIFRKKYNITS